mmetsp:Transcript_2721/g.3179  ORF Transcript_2721/g.3179 Transcript_2721/m.3179 type:complete len:115 (+) Transcript_2721:903-1247(+)
MYHFELKYINLSKFEQMFANYRDKYEPLNHKYDVLSRHEGRIMDYAKTIGLSLVRRGGKGKYRRMPLVIFAGTIFLTTSALFYSKYHTGKDIFKGKELDDSYIDEIKFPFLSKI